ncbi:MAG: hypothetical protein V1837_06755 [Candidatus Woesearchaeota archaeon]
MNQTELTGDSFRNVRWDTLTSTYGSFHATLIGLIVEWWVHLDKENSAFDEGPAATMNPNGKNSKRVDLLLCRNKVPYAVVEIEGSDWENKLSTFEQFFGQQKDKYSFESIQVGIFILYPASMQQGRPRKGLKVFDQIFMSLFQEKVAGLLKNKRLFVITVDESLYNYSKIRSPWDKLRQKNDYYSYDMSRVRLFAFNGDTRPEMEIVLWPPIA